MSISTTVVAQESQLWPQGDIRDPLGVWGARLSVAGDGSGGEIKVAVVVPALRRAAYVYTLYSVNISLTAGTFAASNMGLRILTNWPNIDPTAGVQGYGSQQGSTMLDLQGTTAPLSGFNRVILAPSDRFILMFDPRPGISEDLALSELKHEVNTNGNTYSFEWYGYYWDRSVMQAPGGPRHPGGG